MVRVNPSVFPNGYCDFQYFYRVSNLRVLNRNPLMNHQFLVPKNSWWRESPTKFNASFKHKTTVKDVSILTNAANMSQQKFRGAIIWSRVTTLKFSFCWMKASESVEVGRILSFFLVAKAGFGKHRTFYRVSVWIFPPPSAPFIIL